MKTTTYFICAGCGFKSPKWLGKCPSCDKWDTFSETVEERKHPKKNKSVQGVPTPLGKIDKSLNRTIPSGIGELDRVLGGGFTSNSTVLISGDPGIGKSTLVLKLMSLLSAKGLTCLYVTGEESPEQIKTRAERISAYNEDLMILSDTDMGSVTNAIDEIKPDIVAIDSIQTLNNNDLNSSAGSITQVRDNSAVLIDMAKQNNMCMFFVGHITKEGQIAGPMTLEHMVDTVVYFEGDPKSQYRILRAIKNRFGTTNEIGIFEMTEKGLKEVPNPSQIFLGETCEKTPGSIAMANMEGTRPFLVEVQALCSSSTYSVPTRITTGIDRNRVLLLIAIIEKRLGFNLAGKDIYVNITGGFKIFERASDLPIVCAVASSYLNKIMPKKSFIFGEIGLTGEVRGSKFAINRIIEGQKLGFERCIMPKENLKNFSGRDIKIELTGVEYVDEIPDKVFK